MEATTQSELTNALSPADGPNQAERDYLFDLHGYRVLHGALTLAQVLAINTWIDSQPPSNPGDWVGDVHVHSYQGHDGTNYQNVVEGGEVFEELIDHPSWIGDVTRYICNDRHGLSINENFLNVRETGGFIGIHAGGHVAGFPTVTHHHTGAWMAGQINILMALTDIGPGDGATTVVPGSHKSHEVHPALRAEGERAGEKQSFNDKVVAGDQLGMKEVYLKAGDALMFTDGICHGSSARTNPGQWRVVIYRYSPHVLMPRFNYIASDALMARLTPARKQILAPVPPRMAPGRELRG